MRELQNKQRVRNMLYSLPSLLLLAFIVVMMGKGAYGVLLKERESSAKVAGLEEKIADLSKREAELEESIRRLGTEEGIREEIKEKFVVTEPGEYVAIVIDPRTYGSTTSTTTVNWFRRAWDAIIGR